MCLDNIKNNMNHDFLLSTFACKNSDAIRLRADSDDIRPAFFRDSDRIIYSLSYTRYIDKTQVFTNINNDNISKRMTHVQMVSRIARTIGRALGLNEDLIEAASLGHDLGHVPFGHTGESILNNLSIKNGEGFFNHNIQSVRNLMFVEKNGQGLNLSLQVLDAIMCHNGENEFIKYEPVKKDWNSFLNEYNNAYIDNDSISKMIPMTLEGCVVRISDIVAYLGRDIEDAVMIGRLNIKDVPQDIVSKLGPTNSSIINVFVNDIISNSIGHNYIKMSSENFNLLKKLKKFNYDNIYSKSNTSEQFHQYELMFEKVFNYCLQAVNEHNKYSAIYKAFLNNMSDDYLNSTTDARKVIDFIAGMTDDYLIRQYKAINNN